MSLREKLRKILNTDFSKLNRSVKFSTSIAILMGVFLFIKISKFSIVKVYHLINPVDIKSLEKHGYQWGTKFKTSSIDFEKDDSIHSIKTILDIDLSQQKQEQTISLQYLTLLKRFLVDPKYINCFPGLDDLTGTEHENDCNYYLRRIVRKYKDIAKSIFESLSLTQKTELIKDSLEIAKSLDLHSQTHFSYLQVYYFYCFAIHWTHKRIDQNEFQAIYQKINYEQYLPENAKQRVLIALLEKQTEMVFRHGMRLSFSFVEAKYEETNSIIETLKCFKNEYLAHHLYGDPVRTSNLGVTFFKLYEKEIAAQSNQEKYDLGDVITNYIDRTSNLTILFDLIAHNRLLDSYFNVKFQVNIHKALNFEKFFSEKMKKLNEGDLDSLINSRKLASEEKE